MSSQAKQAAQKAADAVVQKQRAYEAARDVAYIFPVPRPPLPPTLPAIPALPRNDIFDMTKGIKTITYILPCLIAFVLFKNHIKQNYNVTHGRLFYS
ncbi:unnamed protein product [Rhizophagus irregularis]|uniref:Uncharacterized protein n=1 Tax=Rhizophagus irregularis TaxID=588596 RepID=A0A915YVE0_9GLOM|nr:hypothetical protein RIR_jg39605.t1 [Rhizophagus irregularis DAOM 181602=DAOM 197198]CAB4379786.1 unnamed protein product [Rhizophagus irregularis]CAB4474080.1 unnamed protein product [Rhizophagus irregularis]CAB5184206.1 unnamed protein product [Rhizophagus irregularis]CAB5347009.1 unnamed protein product [Rhizophagus irregularis]